MSPAVDVVGVGLNATDTLLVLPAYPARGSKVDARALHELPGGQVATAMVACRHWGLRTRYVGKVGDDAAAALHEAEFARLGVEARLLRVPGCPSHQSFIVVDAGERTVICSHDPRLVIRPDELRREWIADARILLVDGFDTAAATTAATWAREAGIPVVADLDTPFEGLEALLGKIDFLVTNADLPGRWTGQANVEDALRALHARYGHRLTAATLGASGVVAWDGTRFHRASAYRVDIVDTTGAGDVFHAGMLYGILQGWPVQRQLDFACAAAALNCTGVGARGGLGPVDAVERFMRTGTRHSA